MPLLKGVKSRMLIATSGGGSKEKKMPVISGTALDEENVIGWGVSDKHRIREKGTRKYYQLVSDLNAVPVMIGEENRVQQEKLLAIRINKNLATFASENHTAAILKQAKNEAGNNMMSKLSLGVVILIFVFVMFATIQFFGNRNNAVSASQSYPPAQTAPAPPVKANPK